MGEYNSINQNFDSRPSYAVIKSKVGQQDVFLQKFNSDNILEWVVTAGSSSIDLASDVVLDCNDNWKKIPSETKQIFKPSNNGIYALELSNKSCLDTSSCLIVSNLDVTQMDGRLLVLIYPNPTKGLITIASDIPFHSFQIRDVSGSLLFDGEVLSGKFDLSQYDSGLYFVVLYSEIEIYNSKILYLGD